MTKSAADVEREVEASRGELDRTVEALKDKMTPGQLIDEASRAMGGAGQQVLSKFMEQAKENPMPLAVMGLGLAWLMSSSQRSRPAYDGPYGYEPRSFASRGSSGSLGEKIGDAVHTVGDKASEALSTVRGMVSDAAASASDTGHSTAGRLSDLAGSATHRAVDYRRQASRGFMQVLENEPMLVGGLALVVGAAIGAALPSTEAEDRMVGSTRDSLLEKGKDLAQEGLQKASEVAQAAYGGVKSELESANGDATSVADRVEGAARAGVQAVREGFQSQPPTDRA